MKKNTGLVTIGILCFNSEDNILRAIESSINQSWVNKEIIVVDDKSTDNSQNVIMDSRFYKDIIFIRNSKNMGPAYSRNLIIKNSKGEFICFLDDDDISEAYRVEYQIDSIKQAGYPKNKYLVSTCGIERQYSNRFTLKMNPMGSNGDLPSGKEMIDYILFNERVKNIDYGFGSPTCAMLLTKSCFDKVGLFDEELRRVEDLDILIRFGMRGIVFVSSKEILLKQKSTQRSYKTPLENLKSEKILVDKYKAYLSKKGMYMYSKFWPYLRYFHFKKNYFLFFFIFAFLSIRYPLRAINHLIKSGIKRLFLELKISKRLSLF